MHMYSCIHVGLVNNIWIVHNVAEAEAAENEKLEENNEAPEARGIGRTEGSVGAGM